MNEKFWNDEIQWQDVAEPIEALAGEDIYTLKMVDFLQMPVVDFSELILVDPYLRALLN